MQEASSIERKPGWWYASTRACGDCDENVMLGAASSRVGESIGKPSFRSMTISFPEEEAWLVTALEDRKRRVGAGYSATIRIALINLLAQEKGTTPDELPNFLRSRPAKERRASA